MDDKEPNRDDAAKQEARNVEYKEKTEQLLKAHGQDQVLARDPKLLIGIVSAYLLFVATFATVGMLAASSRHDTTSNIFFFVSALLVLIVPVGIIWYFLRVSTSTKPANEDEDRRRLVDRFFQSTFGRLSNRFLNHPLVRVLLLSSYVYWIVDLVLRFPLKPRSSLALIVLYTVVLSVNIALEIVRSFDKAIQAQIKEIWEFNKLVQDLMGPLSDAIVALSKQHEGFVEAQLETNEKTLAAIVEVNRFVRVVANIEEPGPPPEEADENEEPPNIISD